MATLGSLIVQLRTDSANFRQGLDQANSRLSRIEDTAKRAGNNMRNIFAGVAVGATVRSVFQAAVGLERIENSLKSTTGSGAAAAREFAFISDTASKLGLNLQSTAQEYAKFIAAAKGTSLEGQGSRDLFTAVAGASTVLGLDDEQFGGALNALQQMISKGKVQAEELRGQLGERLPGAFQIAARAMGVTTGELDKMLQLGQVVAEDFLPKFAAQLEKEFGGGVSSAADSAQAALNRFETTVFLLKTEFAKSGFLQGLTDGLDALREQISDPSFRNDLQAIGTGIGNLIAVVTENAKDLLIAAGAYKAFTMAFKLTPGPLPFKVAGGAIAAVAAGKAISNQLQSEIDAAKERMGELEGLKEMQARALALNPDDPKLNAAHSALLDQLDATSARYRELKEAGREVNDMVAGTGIAPGSTGEKPTGGGTSPGGKPPGGASTPRTSFIEVIASEAGAVAHLQAQLNGTMDAYERTAAIKEASSKLGRALTEAESNQVLLLWENERKLNSELEWRNELLNRTAQVTAALATPMDEYAAKVANLMDLYDNRAITGITPEQVSTAMEQYALQLEQAAGKTEETMNTMSEFAVQAARNMETAMGTFFFDAMQGRMGDLAGSFKTMIDRMVADYLASQLATALFGGFGKDGSTELGGLVGKGLDALSGIWGGARATGGPVSANRAYIVGEKGPELFSPNGSGNIIPNHRLGGGGVNVYINTPDANSFRASEGQIAAQINRAVNRGRRNL